MHRIIVRALAASVFALSYGPPASAQEAEPEAQATDESERAAPRTIEEITVTARRREEQLQKVPISLTALTNADLQQRMIERVEDLNYQVPNLSVNVNGSRGRTAVNYSIRGIGGDITLPTDPGVGLYFNGIVQARPHGSNQQLYDLESVQVLKGPQGTLFGRNTIAGAILYETKKPTDEFEGEAKVTFGSEARNDLHLIANVPINEDLAVRLNYGFNRRNGYTDVVAFPPRGSRHRAFDDIHSDVWRFSLSWQLTERLHTFIVHDGYDADERGHSFGVWKQTPTGLMARFGAGEFAAQQARGERNIATNMSSQGDEVTVLGIANITTFDLTPDITIKNLIGWRDIEDVSIRDLDGSTIGLLEGQGWENIQQFSNELQLLGTAFDDRLDWITGLYYFREKGDDIFHSLQVSVFAGSPDTPPTRDNATNRSGGTAMNKSYSWFGQGTYQLPWVEGLNFTGGWRWTKDVRDMTSTNTRNVQDAAARCRLVDSDDPAVAMPLDPCTKHVDTTFREPSWTLGLDYQVTDDFMAYVSQRHGYRSGGFAQRAEIPTSFLPFDSAKLNDIELGIKADWRFGDMLLRTNVAWYFIKWRDIQLQRTIIAPSGALATTTVNAAEAELQGFEVEITFSPFEGLEIIAHGAHQDGEFTDFETFDPLLGEISLSGLDFANAKWRGGGTVRYTLPFLSPEIGDVTLTANYFARSTLPGNPLTPKALRSLGEISKYNLVNLRVDWTDVMGWPVDAALFLTNATDQIYVQSQLNLLGTAFGYNAQSFNEPRFWGLSLTYRFGG